jgi:hypothetical protein
MKRIFAASLNELILVETRKWFLEFLTKIVWMQIPAQKKKDLYQTPGRTTGVLRAPFTTRNPAAPGRLIAKTTLHSQTLHKISPKFPQEKTVWSGNRTLNLRGGGLTRSPLSHWRRTKIRLLSECVCARSLMSALRLRLAAAAAEKSSLTHTHITPRGAPAFHLPPAGRDQTQCA